jgi:hypothetical protein
MAEVALDLTLDISFLSPTLRLALFPSQSKDRTGRIVLVKLASHSKGHCLLQ